MTARRFPSRPDSAAELLPDLLLPASCAPFVAGGSVDAVVAPLPTAEVVVSVQSYVVDDGSFPGPDVGSLAIRDAVRDLAKAGAVPVAVAVAFVVEEGFDPDELTRVSLTLGDAARDIGVKVVSGDTVMVDAAAGRMFLTVTGMGVRRPLAHHPQALQPASTVRKASDLRSIEAGL